MNLCKITKTQPDSRQWEDITHKVKTQVRLLGDSILVYLQDEKESDIGLWDAKGFYPMTFVTEIKYKIFPSSKVAEGITWFKVYRKKEK